MSNKFDPLFPNQKPGFNEKEAPPKLERPTYNNITSEILCLLPADLASKLVGRKLSEILKVIVADEKLLDDISSLPPDERSQLYVKNISEIRQKQEFADERVRILRTFPLEIRNKFQDASLEKVISVSEGRKKFLSETQIKTEQKIALERETGAEDGLADKYVNNPVINEDLSGELVIHASPADIKNRFVKETGGGLFYSEDFGHLYDKGGLKKNHFLYIIRKANQDQCIDQAHGWYQAKAGKEGREIEDLIVLPEVKKGDVKAEEKFQKILKILRAKGAQASGMEYKG